MCSHCTFSLLEKVVELFRLFGENHRNLCFIVHLCYTFLKGCVEIGVGLSTGQKLRQVSSAFAARLLRVLGHKVAEPAEVPTSCASSLATFACTQNHLYLSVHGSSPVFHSSRNVDSLCSPVHLKTLALAAMCFSFLVHEMEMIIFICLPHTFVERIN